MDLDGVLGGALGEIRGLNRPLLRAYLGGAYDEGTGRYGFLG
ncbi:unnamed protein product [Choristocarpus tenellus]